MEQFSHLKFVQKLIGKPRFFPGGSENPKSQKNRKNKIAHSRFLLRGTNWIKSDWEKSIKQRELQGLPEIDNSAMPVFLQINPDLINAEFDLESFGIEIISEEENGFIIGASNDNLRSLEAKIRGFLKSTHGSAKIADFWQIVQGSREIWKPEHILSEFLLSHWREIEDDKYYMTIGNL